MTLSFLLFPPLEPRSPRKSTLQVRLIEKAAVLQMTPDFGHRFGLVVLPFFFFTLTRI